MTAHAHPSITARAFPALPSGRRRSRAFVGVPLVLGICYGLYAAFLTSNNGASNERIMIESFVGGAVVVVLCLGIAVLQRRLMPEMRGALYGVVFGCAMGYLVALSDMTWLKSVFIGLFCGAGMAATVFWIRYTHQR
ncbi:hypothetical protein [Streptomyces sp. NPDC047108]|uniref:hypothetical protein n=1 Tax=Streptomyces sp. NPDC047108 TaxID=3155025 RepID=UPI0034064979